MITMFKHEDIIENFVNLIDKKSEPNFFNISIKSRINMPIFQNPSIILINVNYII